MNNSEYLVSSELYNEEVDIVTAMEGVVEHVSIDRHEYDLLKSGAAYIEYLREHIELLKLDKYTPTIN